MSMGFDVSMATGRAFGAQALAAGAAELHRLRALRAAHQGDLRATGLCGGGSEAGLRGRAGRIHALEESGRSAEGNSGRTRHLKCLPNACQMLAICRFRAIRASLHVVLLRRGHERRAGGAGEPLLGAAQLCAPHLQRGVHRRHGGGDECRGARQRGLRPGEAAAAAGEAIPTQLWPHGWRALGWLREQR